MIDAQIPDTGVLYQVYLCFLPVAAAIAPQHALLYQISSPNKVECVPASSLLTRKVSIKMLVPESECFEYVMSN